jgi:CDP-diacylglycerol--serine O-phosphatidyltransferase
MNKSAIPNMFTFINLSFGMLSIIAVFSGEMRIAALMILFAALVDRYDGRIARRFNAESSIGKELDSLADLVSFGAAPALLSWGVSLQHFGIIGYIITIIFPIAGAFRLARYNTTQFDNVFSGVPITIAGCFIALDNIISLEIAEHRIVAASFVIAFSYLMVSNIKIKKM